MSADLLQQAPEVQPERVLPEPEPLDTAARLKPWPEGAILPPDLEDYGLAFADRLCLDPGPVLMAMLAATTAVTNGRVWIEPDADNPTWQEPTALWLSVVMGVSTKKTPLLKAALAPLWHLEGELRKAYGEEWAKHETELANWESAKRSERGPKPKPPVPERLLAQDATREALAELLAHNPGILSYHDELSGLFRTWNREDRGADRAFYLSAYSAAPVSVDRILRGSTHIPRPVLSLIGFVQPGPFRERVLEAQSSDGAGADGLLQRFIVVTAQERPWVDERPAIPLQAKERYHALIARLYDTLRHSDERVLRLDDEAQALWYQWETEVERAIRDPDHPDAWRALLGKRLGLTARLAAVLHLLWEESGDVSATTLRRAIALVLWLEPHARRIWHRALSGNDEPVLRLARKLRAGELEQFTERHLAHRNVAGIATIAEARRVVARLLEAGWIIREGEGYRANPRVGEVEHV